MAVLLTAMTPVITDAGEWLYSMHKHPSAILQTHAHLGGTMIYFSVALLVVAVVLAALHLVEGRSDKRRLIANIERARVNAVFSTAIALTVRWVSGSAVPPQSSGRSGPALLHGRAIVIGGAVVAVTAPAKSAS